MAARRFERTVIRISEPGLKRPMIREPKVDAIVFDFDDTLITHSYGRRLPRPELRDATVLPLLAELAEAGVKLFVASAYVPGIDPPGLLELLRTQGFERISLPRAESSQETPTRVYQHSSEIVELPFPTNIDNCVAQKRILMQLLDLDPGLFEAIYSFPYVHTIGDSKEEYIRGKQKIFEDICRSTGINPSRVLAISDEEGERSAALALGMGFVPVERATARLERVAEGRRDPGPELRDLLLPYLFH